MAAQDDGDGFRVSGRIKWFDATRGFGFLVSEQFDGDILVHFSVLRDHGRRSLPEGALIECIVEQQERGLQARRIISIDLSEALPSPAQTVHRCRLTGPTARRWPTRPATFEPVEVKWFNRVKGYGFVNRLGRARAGHLRAHGDGAAAGLADLQPGRPARGADRRGAQGPDRGRTARCLTLKLLLAAFAAVPRRPPASRAGGAGGA